MSHYSNWLAHAAVSWWSMAWSTEEAKHQSSVTQSCLINEKQQDMLVISLILPLQLFEGHDRDNKRQSFPVNCQPHVCLALLMYPNGKRKGAVKRSRMDGWLSSFLSTADTEQCTSSLILLTGIHLTTRSFRLHQHVLFDYSLWNK